MSNAAIRLTLRQKPHLDFVIGYPGLVPDDSTKQASLEGTVEVRVQNPVHTQWLKVELKKTEVVQTSKGIRKYFELIGSKEQMLWEGKDKDFADADKFAPLDTSDHAFAIPIPPGLPPSIVLDKSKNTGIVYHLVATAMIKAKSKSLFGGSGNSFKPPSLVTQIAEVTIEKHELNPSWPIYAWQAENTPLQVRQANLSMHLKRETVIFGGNDPVKLDVEIRSERNAPVKITRIELQLKEIITTREADGVARGGSVDPKKTLQHSYDILSLRSPCHNVLYQNEGMSHALSAVFPVHHSHFTVQNAKHLDVKYTMRLRAVVEVPKEAKLKRGEKREKEEPIKEIILDNVAVIISPWSKKQAEWWRAKIGTIPKNLQRPDTINNTQATSVSNQPQMNGQVSNTNMSPMSSPNPASPPRALSGPMVYGSSPAAAASRAFSQRVQQGNQVYASQHSQSNQPLQPVQPRQSTQPAQPVAMIQAEPMNATRSQEEQRALAIQQGKRLSSWPPPERKPPPPPTIAVSEHEPGTSDTALPPGAAESQEVLATAEQQYQPTQGRQTQSDVGHGTMFWQPSREVASLDGHAAQLRHSPPPKPYQMDGAYPVARSKSHSQGINTMGYANPWSPPASVGHRRVFSDGGRSTRQGSQPTPPHIPYFLPDQNRRLSTPALSSSTPMQLNSTPVLSSSIPINTRKDSNGSQTKKRMHVETTQGGFPTRKNTLSTITGSAPSSAQSSPVYETQSVPMPSTEWESAEAEKERLYNEATERARRTQERAGNTIPEAMPVEEQYRSVQDRTPTPLSLMRTVSNPETGDARRNEMQGMYGLGPPSPMHNNRHSVASTQLGYLNSQSENGRSRESLHSGILQDSTEGSHENGRATDSDRLTSRRHSHHGGGERQSTGVSHSNGYGFPQPIQAQHSSSSVSYPQPQPQSALSPLSPSTTRSAFSKLDPQKMAYLKALAAREAYQQRMAGTQPEPLTALEEKQRLQRMFEEEEQRAERGEDAWERPPDVLPRVHHEQDTSIDGAADRPHDPNRSYEEVQQQRQYDDFTPQSSVYLTPDTTQGKWQPRSNIGVNGNSFHNPYFESPTSSSTHLPSDGSSLSQSYRRNPAITKGKQRRQSTYLSENDNPYEDGTNALANGPPARPPKGRDLMYDTYKHFDTPVSPSAEEYERRLLWGRSQNSRHGHG